MTKALVNALTLALAEEYEGRPLTEWREFAARFFEENRDLLGPPVIVDMQGRALGPQPVAAVPELKVAVKAPEKVEPVGTDPETGEPVLPRAVVHYVPIVGPDGLTDKQRKAIGGVGLCPNCQQPNNAHLPGCARASGYDTRAKTKDPLPPVV